MYKILVTGSTGMLGSNFSKTLKDSKYFLIKHTRSDADLTSFEDTQRYFKSINPSLVIHCAALVGGIQANVLGGLSFYSVNRMIDENVLNVCQSIRVPKLIYVSSSCMYPANSKRLLTVEDLGLEPLEPTNRNYALAKIWGTKRVEQVARETGLAWRTIVSSNLYGPFDHFDNSRGHLVASIIYKVVQAKKLGLKEVEMWGDGNPRREFTYAPEFVEWIVNKIEYLEDFPCILNLGYGRDYTVRQFYEWAISRVDSSIQIVSNEKMPNGNMNKLMDSTPARSFGWNPQVSPEVGISKTLDWYLSNTIL